MAEYTGKYEILKDLKQRVEDKILEPSNYDLLEKLVENANTLDEAIKIAELGTTYRRTGFHFNKKLEKKSDTISYFKKNEKLSFTTNPESTTHKLIIGDNYPALLNLLVEYRGKVDVIYIDPPYGKDSMGEFAQTNYENAISRDNLLSMLYPRLWVAKQLLCENGVIFCSIDDKNHAQIKSLFDEIFGENNFIGNLNILDNLKGKENDNFLSQTSHYVLSYAKKKPTNKEWGFNSVPGDRTLESKYSSIDEDGNIFTTNTFKKTGASKNREDRPLMFYPVLVNRTTNEFGSISDEEFQNIYVDGVFNDGYLKELSDKYTAEYKFILPKDTGGRYLRWTSGFPAYKKLIANNMLVINNNNSVDQIKYPKELELVADSVFGTPKNFVYKKEFANGTNEIIDVLVHKELFDNPKSISLMKYLILLVQGNENSIVLDFFAGSGTTGQAVLELNREDGGNRQFILVTNNEITEANPKGIAYDVTSRRLKRVMTGEDYDGNKNFKWALRNEPLGNNLLVLDLAEVANFESANGKTPFDAIDEVLYGQKKLGVNEKIEWVSKNFEQTQKRLEDK